MQPGMAWSADGSPEQRGAWRLGSIPCGGAAAIGDGEDGASKAGWTTAAARLEAAADATLATLLGGNAAPARQRLPRSLLPLALRRSGHVWLADDGQRTAHRTAGHAKRKSRNMHAAAERGVQVEYDLQPRRDCERAE